MTEEIEELQKRLDAEILVLRCRNLEIQSQLDYSTSFKTLTWKEQVEIALKELKK